MPEPGSRLAMPENIECKGHRSPDLSITAQPQHLVLTFPGRYNIVYLHWFFYT
jgi:hypothetical protein